MATVTAAPLRVLPAASTSSNPTNPMRFGAWGFSRTAMTNLISLVTTDTLTKASKAVSIGVVGAMAAGMLSLAIFTRELAISDTQAQLKLYANLAATQAGETYNLANGALQRFFHLIELNPTDDSQLLIHSLAYQPDGDFTAFVLNADLSPIGQLPGYVPDEEVEVVKQVIRTALADEKAAFWLLPVLEPMPVTNWHYLMVRRLYPAKGGEPKIAVSAINTNRFLQWTRNMIRSEPLTVRLSLNHGGEILVAESAAAMPIFQPSPPPASVHEPTFIQGRTYYQYVMPVESTPLVVTVSFPSYDVSNRWLAVAMLIVVIGLGATVCILLLLKIIRDQVVTLLQKSNVIIALRNRFQAVTEQMFASIYLRRLDGTVVIANPAFARLCGVSSTADLVGKNIGEIQPSFTPRVLAENVRRALEAEGQKSILWHGEWPRQDGSVLPVEVEYKIIRVGNDAPLILGAARDVSGEIQNQARLEKLLTTDELTGLANRRLLSERLSHAITEAAAMDSLCAVLLIDLDHFKRVNDVLTHQAGDFLLRLSAHRLLSCVRSADSVARLSGDAFAVILRSFTEPEQVEQVAQRILESFRILFEVTERQLTVTATIGIAFYPSDGASPSELLHRAEMAMYEGKSTGRDRMVFFNRMIRDRVFATSELNHRLHTALEQQEFSMVYQPVFDVRSWTISRIEALIRWNHPEQGTIFPNDFIPHAEDSNLIIDIGNWGIEAVCQQIAAWNVIGIDVPVSINISSRHITDSTFIPTVANNLARYHIPPSRLEVEVTELFISPRADDILAVIGRLQALGVGVILDNFGAGSSCLHHLSAFAPTMVKVDQSLTLNLLDDKQSQALIRALLALASSLHFDLAAELVEQDIQMEWLRQEGCYLQQGFFFSEPLEAKVLEELYANQNEDLEPEEGRDK